MHTAYLPDKVELTISIYTLPLLANLKSPNFKAGFLKLLKLLMSQMLFQVCLSRTVRAQGGLNSLELWQTERPREMANIADLQVMCGKQHMEVEVTFDKPFNGIIFSKV